MIDTVIKLYAICLSLIVFGVLMLSIINELAKNKRRKRANKK